MNSEELELSLRTEFENYLKGVLAEMRQEVAEFQKNFEGELEKHRSQIDEAFRAFSTRFDAESEFDDAFKGLVSEHLRLARDDGAKITAEAFAEAEKLERAAAPVVGFNGIRDAVHDISTQDSQSTILKSLVQHAVEFARAGAFFIIKNEQLAGWKVFGSDTEAAENEIRELHLPVSADTVLGSAVTSMSTVESAAGAHPEDAIFLDKLHFGHPDRMYAVPLIARGKSVAVLYADYGNDGVHLNCEALETLVRVAGLTVELHASSQSATPDNQPAADLGSAAETEQQGEDQTPSHEPEAHFEEPVYDIPSVTPASEISGPPDFSFSENHDGQYEDSFQQAEEPAFEVEDSHTDEASPSSAYEFDSGEHVVETEAEPVQEETPVFEPVPAFEPEAEAEENSSNGAVVFDSPEPVEPITYTESPFEAPVEEYAPAGTAAGAVFEHATEPVSEVAATQMPRSRLSDRPVDLPIDVPESERRLHNDARRFARLLVSEIKLYNEKKVLEGRQSHDLYDRLREAIDRSREMYDKRVQPPVAAKFDYFHYELVNALAEGKSESLGSGYPGGSI